MNPMAGHLPKFPIRIALLGDDLSGKSNIFSRYIWGTFHGEITPTYSTRIGSKLWIINEPTAGLVDLELIDTERLFANSQAPHHVWSGVNVAVLCIPASQIHTASESIQNWLNKTIVREFLSRGAQYDFCILFTKVDALNEEEKPTFSDKMMDLSNEFSQVEYWGAISSKVMFGILDSHDFIKQIIYYKVKQMHRSAGHRKSRFLGVSIS